MKHSRIIHSSAGDIDCPVCKGSGLPESGNGKYWDDDFRCWMPDYCDHCFGTGLVAVACQYCEGSVSHLGYCTPCDEYTPVAPAALAAEADDLDLGEL